MQYKKIMILAILLVCILTVSAVNAAENATDDIASSENQDNDVISEIDNNASNETSKTFADLDIAINGNNDSDVYLDEDYTFEFMLDSDYMGGVPVNRNVTVHGNGHIIDGDVQVRIFNVSNSHVVFKDIVFVNGTDMWYGDIPKNGGAIYISGGSVSAVNCTFINNSARYGGAIYSSGGSVSAVDCTFVGNSASNYGGAVRGGTYVNCTFTDNFAEYGGAMYGGACVNCTFVNNYASNSAGAIFSGHAINCSFINNSASSYGGAIRGGYAVNCIFTNNSADCGGAMYGYSVSSNFSALNCSFVSNSASNYGGAVYDCNSVVNSSFVNNSAWYGGAIQSSSSNSAVNCIFTGNHADYGAAIYAYKTSFISENCSFINNSARESGGAVNGGLCANCTFVGNSAWYGGATANANVVNCKFINNSAGNSAGAMYSYSSPVSAVNCTFIGNFASNNAGAMYYADAVNCTFEDNYAGNYGGAFAGKGKCVNCTFINNEADTSGGAMFAFTSDNISAVNCTFVGNTARNKNGGAMCGSSSSSLSALNCIFIDNSADFGGAILVSSSTSTSIENCTFKSNSADTSGGAMYGGSAVNCTFAGNSARYGGAMFSSSSDSRFALDCTFINNTASNGGAVRNIAVVKNCSFEYNSADRGGAMNNGKAIDCTFNNNDASVYGGAVCDAKVSTSCQFSNNDAPEGSDTYNVIWFVKKISLPFSDLNEIINGNNDADVYLNSDYTFDLTADSSFINGISIDRNVTVHGNGYTIDADNFARIFKANFSCSIVFEDIIFVNGKTAGNGSAVTGGSAVNCTFINNTANYGGAAYDTSCVNCTFINNSASNYGGAIICSDSRPISIVNCSFISNFADDAGAIYGEGVSRTRSSVSIVNCTFIGNHADDSNVAAGGAIYINSGSIVNSTFVNNSAHWGGVIYASYYDYGEMDIVNCTFVNNSAYWAGALYMISQFDGVANIVNCNFVNNSADSGCGALYVVESGNIANVLNCSFINNSAPNKGGAVNWDSKDGVLSGCTFEACTVNAYGDSYGGAVYWGGANGTIVDCSFVDCSAVSTNGNSYGGGIYFTAKDCYLINPYFENNFANNGSDWYSVYPVKNETPVIKKDTVLVASNVTTAYSDSAVITIALTDDEGNALTSEQITISLNGESYFATTGPDGQASFNVPANLVPNSYIALISYDGNDKYNPSNATAAVTVTKMDTALTSSDVTAMYQDGSKLVATLKDANGNAISGAKIKIAIPNKLTKYITTDADGQVSLDISNLDVGSYSAVITFVATDLYNKASTTAKVTVINKIDTVLTASDVTAVYKVSGNLVATLSDVDGNAISGAKLKIVIPGKITKYITTDANGQVSLNVANMDVGTYTATITFVATELYNKATTTAKVTVTNKIDTVLTADDVTAVYKVSGNLVATLKDTAGNAISGAKIKIVINKVSKYITTDANGQVSLNVANYDIGNYTATITFVATELYNKATTTAKITVINKIDTVLTAADVTASYKDGSKLVVTLKDAAGNVISGAKIKIVINKVSKYISTDANGQVALSLSNLDLGNYTATITFLGDDVYNKATTTAKISIVNKIDTVLTAPDVTANYKDGSKLVATLKDTAGNAISGAKIKIVLNKVTKYISTDANGQVALSLSNLNVGSYTAAITFVATDLYNKSTANAKVTIV